MTKVAAAPSDRLGVYLSLYANAFHSKYGVPMYNHAAHDSLLRQADLRPAAFIFVMTPRSIDGIM